MRKALIAPIIVGLISVAVIGYGMLFPDPNRPLVKTSEKDGPPVTFIIEGIVTDGSATPAATSADLTVRVGDYFLVDKPAAGWTHVIGSSPAPLTHPTAALWLFNQSSTAAFRFHVFLSEEAGPQEKMAEMTDALRQAGFIVKPLTGPPDGLVAVAFERDPNDESTGWKAQGAIVVGRVAGKPELSFYVVGLWSQSKKAGSEMTSALLKTAKTVRAVPPSK